MRATVESVSGGATKVVHCRLSDPFAFQPGQYLVIHDQGRTMPMSLASPQHRLPYFELHFRPLTDSADADVLANLFVPGAELELSGPAGDVRVPADDQRPLTLICGGTGSSQAFSIVGERAHVAGAGHSVSRTRWLWAVGTASDWYAEEQLQELKRHRWLSMHRFADPATGETNALMRWVATHAEQLAGDRLVLCGSPGFVYQSVDVLTAQGIAESAMESDVFAYAPR